MDDVAITVSVDDAHLSTLGEVVQALRGSGMIVDEVLDDLGVVTGVVPADRRSALTAVPGVVDVSEQRRIQLPPPDSPVQ